MGKHNHCPTLTVLDILKLSALHLDKVDLVNPVPVGSEIVGPHHALTAFCREDCLPDLVPAGDGPGSFHHVGKQYQRIAGKSGSPVLDGTP